MRLCFIHGRSRTSLRSASMGAGASTLRGELIDKRQALMAAGDRFDEAAFDAAAVDGRVPRAVLIEISSWLQTIRDGATELDLTGPTLLGGRVGAGPAGSRKRGTMRLARLRCRAPCHGRAVLLSCDACRLVGCCTPQGRKSALRARELWRPCSRGTQRSRCSTSTVRGSVLAVAGEGGMCGAVPRRFTARGRTMQSELARCSWAARVRRRVPLPGAWLLFLSA